MNQIKLETVDEVKSSVHSNRSDHNDPLFLGQDVAKDFLSPFFGEVVAVPDRFQKYYRVEFEDGDEEDYTYTQIKRYAESYRRSPEGRGDSRCSRGRKNHISVGTKISKDFNRTFAGKIIGIPKEKEKLYTVRYDADGMVEKVGTEEVISMVEEYKKWIKYEAEPDVVMSTSNDISVGTVPPILAANSGKNNNHATKIQDEEEVQIVRDTELKGMTQVKLEMFNKATGRRVSNNYEERQKRLRERAAAIQEPSGAPRKVFRRGCNKASLTQVLGGIGTDPAPIVLKVPMEDQNPFIKRGEYYFAGRSDWNPWTPAYPTDEGFIDSKILQRGNQAVFHCFLNCAKKPYQPHYLGPNAKGKYLYLGRYRVVPTDRHEVNIEEKKYMFRSLEWESQCTYAEWKVRHDSTVDMTDKKDARYHLLTTDLAMREYAEAAKTKAENEQEGLWESLEEHKKQERAWIEMLLDNNYNLSIRPVEFVDYDENLYNKLVEIGANNGEVSLNPNELGPL